MKSILLDRISWFVVGVAPEWQPFSRLLLKRPPLVEPSREVRGASSPQRGRWDRIRALSPAAPKVRACVRKVARNSLSSPEVGKRAKGDAGAVERARRLLIAHRRLLLCQLT